MDISLPDLNHQVLDGGYRILLESREGRYQEQELFKIWADNVWEIGTVGLTPMVQGVVVVNANLRNVPEIAGNDWPLRTPGDTRPEQYFYAQ